MRIAEWRKRFRLTNSPVLDVAAVALVTAVINYPNVFMRYIFLPPTQFPQLLIP
jgi:hypothetical protein